MCWCQCVQILCQEMSVLISFIIPYHNEPQWMLDECIASIEALDLLPDEYEVLVEHDVEDEGPSLTRNRAIEKARGEYIQFVDCDDRLFPASYARIIAFVREKRMDMLMFRFSSTDRERVSRNGLSRRKARAEWFSAASRPPPLRMFRLCPTAMSGPCRGLCTSGVLFRGRRSCFTNGCAISPETCAA